MSNASLASSDGVFLREGSLMELRRDYGCRMTCISWEKLLIVYVSVGLCWYVVSLNAAEMDVG